jgi:hypothetical protein
MSARSSCRVDGSPVNASRRQWALVCAWALVNIAAIIGLFNPRLAFLLGTSFISLCSIYANMGGHIAAAAGHATDTQIKEILAEVRALRSEVAELRNEAA